MDAGGDLVSITDPDGAERRFEYNTSTLPHQMTKQWTARNHLTEYFYESNHGRFWKSERRWSDTSLPPLILRELAYEDGVGVIDEAPGPVILAGIGASTDHSSPSDPARDFDAAVLYKSVDGADMVVERYAFDGGLLSEYRHLMEDDVVSTDDIVVRYERNQHGRVTEVRGPSSPLKKSPRRRRHQLIELDRQ